ncbi:NAD-dependent epimerase/dehydratase family protein [Pedobacter arcticus]|uniref:NAD-dependent epimerase/dehydratase family protein n=1 Tax=Pedobacter arcticus TaxID=752140 RepID=UPI0002F6138E|nr:NAD(P)-dependent oxidoreductase [Pedobacter arcticus]
MRNKKNVLLTGASGTVGAEVLKQLFAKNTYAITVFDIESKKSKSIFAKYKNKIEIVYGDISNENDVIKIASDKDVVIHLASIIPPLADEQPELTYRVNTLGTKILVNCLEKYSPNCFFLYSSSISVYGDRLHNPLIKTSDELKPSEGDKYAETKIQAEQLITSSMLSWSIFRLCAIMGGHKISKLMFHQPLATSLEIATPEDTARAFVNAIEKQEMLAGKIFDLGGGKNCRIKYEDFLAKSFDIYGLGKLAFPPKSFAEKNFHCGYYSDGDILENILKFRRNDLDDYFEKEKQKVSTLQKVATTILRVPIKSYLLKQSEPLEAYKNKNKQLTDFFFEKN